MKNYYAHIGLKCLTRIRLLLGLQAHYTMFRWKKPLQALGFTLSKRIDQSSAIVVWGRKKFNSPALKLAKKYNLPVTYIEDGFLRSLHSGSDSIYALTIDPLGVYYDAHSCSQLETSLNTPDLVITHKEKQTAETAIDRIKNYHISKYNDSLDLPNNYFSENQKVVLIIDQVPDDLSLIHGFAEHISIDSMIQSAQKDHPEAKIVIKPHPVNLKNNLLKHLSKCNHNVQILTENFNPISLLKQIDYVYTMTSQLGFEALLMGKEVTCFGLPFYAGWGLTKDHQKCKRRTQKRSVLEVFIVAYLRLSHYYNPNMDCKTDILTAIHYLHLERQKYLSERLIKDQHINA